MNLALLTDRMPVRYRTSIRDTEAGTSPDWSEWREGSLYVDRREQTLNRWPHRKNHKKGAILTLTIREMDWAEYSEDDYSPEDNVWLKEHYRLQFTPWPHPNKATAP